MNFYEKRKFKIELNENESVKINPSKIKFYKDGFIKFDGFKTLYITVDDEIFNRKKDEEINTLLTNVVKNLMD